MQLYRKKWIQRAEREEPDPSLPLLERVLAARGWSKAKAQAFLQTGGEGFHDPFLLPDMDAACDAVLYAITGQQLILVYGDYDADGVTATALLVDFLRQCGALVGWYIPGRLDEGYGLSMTGVGYAVAAGAGLVITVDCGIRSFEEAEQLAAAGVGLVITDHHQCGERLPNAAAVVNPHRSDSAYPFQDICGAAVALKLTQALSQCLECPDLWRSGLDLAAVGTVADIMPLMDENRAIVQAGLQRMEAAPRLGLTALLEALEVSARPLRSAAIAYRIAPALNAAGRMGDSLSGVECLTARDEVRARAKAAHLVRLNQERRTTEREVAERLNDLLVQEPERLAHPVLVVEGADWHPGVLGILAARLSEELLRPVVVLSADGEEAETAPIVYKGSARSYGRFNIYEALQSAAGILLQFGGHEQAAGLEVHAADLPALQAALDQYAFDHPEQGRFPVPPELIYDLTVQPEVLTLEAVRSLEALEPFGRGNREPVLRLGPVAVSSVRTIGKDQNHLKFRLPSGNGWLDVVAFGFGEYIQLLSPGVAVELCGSPSINTWNGQESVQILAKDLRPVTSGPDDEAQQQELDARFAAAPSGLSPEQLAARLDVAVAELTIGKEAWGGVYLFLKSALRSGYGMARTDVLLERVNERLSRPISHFQLRRILSVYEEAGLLYISESSGGIISVSLRRVEQKVDLYQTPTYLKMQGGGA